MILKQESTLYLARMFSGEDIMLRLSEAAESSGHPLLVMASAAGMLENPEIGYFAGKDIGYERKIHEGIYEIVSLSGNIVCEPGAGSVVHLHVSLAARDNSVIGGHLFAASVYGTGEFFLILSDMRIRRELEEETGLKGLKI